MDDREDIRANAGYALAQLLRVLQGRGERTAERAAQWRQVLAGMFDGSLRIGLRTPISDVPVWATLDVVHGGFATGNLAAAGPLLPHEMSTLAALLPADATDRARLNVHAIGDGGAELVERLRSGRFRTTVPEEGALLVATWLVERGESERATALLDAILPFFDRLRFYPVPHERALRSGTAVYVQPVGATVASLRAKRPQARVAAMNEALRVWTPLYDHAVSLFLETVEGETRSLRRTADGLLERAANGQPIVTGGWPCRVYASDWRARGRQLLDEYTNAHTGRRLCGKPEKRDESFARLRGYLATCVTDPRALTGRDVGAIRKILASYVAKHGAPDSARWTAKRMRQARDAALPLHHELARDLAERLAAVPSDEGSPDVDAQVQGLPRTIRRKALRSWEAPLESLIERDVIRSSESMARVLPLLTARVRASAIADPALSRVYEAVYLAFRRRRSLLLLELASQAKLSELPWIAAVEPWVGSDDASRSAARETLVRVATTAFTAFPYTILPNKLVRELGALATAAGSPMPLVEELAADIFMGTFTEKFLRAAKLAARMLRGTLYERYYGLPFARVLELEDVPKAKGPPVSPGFAAICTELAGATTGDHWSVARNGTVIEQAQILTTHNLAVLFDELALRERLDLGALARRTFEWVCRRQQMTIRDWQARMQMVKNTAYAWRQMIFFVSMMPSLEADAFVEWTRAQMSRQPQPFVERFAPVVDGLGASGGRRFVGWSVGRHWVLD